MAVGFIPSIVIFFFFLTNNTNHSLLYFIILFLTFLFPNKLVQPAGSSERRGGRKEYSEVT